MASSNRYAPRPEFKKINIDNVNEKIKEKILFANRKLIKEKKHKFNYT